MLRKFIKTIIFHTYWPGLSLYFRSERKYYYENLRLVVLPGVFHPGLFHSTRFLYEELKKINFKNKHVLDLGSGTGILAIYCTQKGAITIASDISWKAIVNIDKNLRWNRVAMSIIQSDLFTNIQKQQFDYIIINPPYYKRNPKTESDYAWYCGVNLEYFIKLFKQMPAFMHEQSCALMVLSQDCDIKKIKVLAEQNNFIFTIFAVKNVFLEKQYIFRVSACPIPAYPLEVNKIGEN
jgi:release factor glutamine methyltransferase